MENVQYKIDEKYAKALTEVLYYLKGIATEDVNKIPNTFIKYLEKNADYNYKCNFDYTKSLNDIVMSKEARGLINTICLNYWCETEEQKNMYINKLKENEDIIQAELRKKYNPDVFASRRIANNETTTSTENQMIEYKENIFNKLWKKIKNMFKKNN